MQYASKKNRKDDDDDDDADQQVVIAAEDEETSPVVFLQSLFPQDQQPGRRPRSSATSSPIHHSDSQMDDYTMDVVRAIRASDVAKLREMLHNGRQSFEACNNNGEHLIHLACRRGDLQTVQFLLYEACVSVHVVDDMGRSILHDVCWKSRADTELMDLLLTRMSPELLLQPDMRGHTPLDYARKEHWSIWNAYLRQRQDVITRTSRTTSAAGTGTSRPTSTSSSSSL
jgi:Ankyrin repeats (3 copies)